MRQLLFFDLPTLTAEDRREYTKFRKFLISEGFLMLQYSVYSKISLNDTQAKTIMSRIEKNKPSNGSVVVLKVTEKQFANMSYVLGNKNMSFANSEERIIFLGKRLAEEDDKD